MRGIKQLYGIAFIAFLVITSASGSPSSYHFIVVDPQNGNDSTCTPLVIDFSTPAGSTLYPCATIGAALISLNSTADVNFWLHMRPGTYLVPHLMAPVPSLTISINLPSLPIQTNYSFPTTLIVNNSRVTWDCLDFQYCIRSSLPGLTIEGVSFRNVLFHAVHHVGTIEQLTDLTLSQVDCQDSGGLLYKTNGSVIMNQVSMVNATIFPNAPDFDSSISLIHFMNVNVSITDSVFKGSQINGNFLQSSSTMHVFSQTGLTTFTMVRSTMEGNVVDGNYPVLRPSWMTCSKAAALGFNATDINIVVDSCDFINNVVYGSSVSAVAMGVFSGSELGHSISLKVMSSRFINNSYYSAPEDGFLSVVAGLMVSGDYGFFVGNRAAESSPIVILDKVSFIDNFGGAVTVQKTSQINITDSYFIRNGAIYAGAALLIYDAAYKNVLSGLHFISNTVFDSNMGPPIVITSSFPTVIINSIFKNSVHGIGGAGALAMDKWTHLEANPQLSIDNTTFVNNVGDIAGAINLKYVSAIVTNSYFTDNRAQQGGAAAFQFSNVDIQGCHFTNNSLFFERTSTQQIVSIEGGAIFAVSSIISLSAATISRSSAQGTSDLQACANVMSDATGPILWRGGAISLHETSFTLSESSIDGSSSCTGGDIYADGNSVYIIDTTISNSRSYSGGSLAVKDINTLFITATDFSNVSGIVNGGAMIFSTVDQFIISESSFENIQSQTGDGGVIYIASLSEFAKITAFDSTFTNCSAPLGGGSIVFTSSLNGGNVKSFGFSEIDNNIVMPPPIPYIQWGELQATNVLSISSSIDAISVYPGQAFSENQYATPFNISVLAIDGFNQTVRGDRGMVIQCSLVQANPDLPTRKAALSGTILKQMTSKQEAAVFDDLSITAEPGAYQLIFTVVGVSTIQSISVSVEVGENCPSTLFYRDGSCNSCPNSLLVYDPTVGSCVACDPGRVATSDGKCAICDLGWTNYGSPNCIKCSSNTYQPVPLSNCATCLDEGMEGLKCTDGLAVVQPGYFAFSALVNGSSVPTLQTVQCPDGYCDGSIVQANWTDPMNQLQNNSASTVVPYFASAVTRFDQCAYPRLASEDNYLCGECVPGLIAWGDKCSKCDRADGGRVVLFLFLSFALVIFLVRSSLASASAGHTTILLYFIQTAMLEIGSASSLISWMKIGLLSPSSFSDCVAPVDVYQQSTFQLLMPLFLLGEMLIVMTLHYACFRFRSRAGNRANTAAQGPQSHQSAFALRSRFLSVIDSFSIDLYISASMSILLFTYTQVMTESFRMLACVDVAGVSVVFSQPTMRCDSDRYKRHMVLVGIVIAYVGFLPFAVSFFLWRNMPLVQMSHELMKFEDTEIDEAAMVEYAAGDAKASVNSPKPSNEEVSRFLLRYSAVFSMYSARAWGWKSVLLSRRIVFAAISVSLVRHPSMKFFAFALTHLVSMLLQGYFRPFEQDFFNWMEIASHVVLIVLSQSLTVILPPLSYGNQVYLFMLIILPICLYGVIVLTMRFVQLHQRRSLEQLIFTRGSIAFEKPPTNMHANRTPNSPSINQSSVITMDRNNEGNGAIEMNHIQTNGSLTNDSAGLRERVQPGANASSSADLELLPAGTASSSSEMVSL